MRHLFLTAVWTFLLLSTTPAWAQFGVQDTKGPQLGAWRTQQWTVGTEITASRGPCFGIFATVPVPTSWPEQTVRLVDERVSDTVPSVRPRKLDDGVVQMLVTVPRLNIGEKAEALMTYEITRREVLLPQDTSLLKIPRRVPRELGKYIGTSPLIESRDSRIRRTVNEITAEKEGAWETVEAIHDWVKENIEHSNDVDKTQNSSTTLKERKGHHENLSNLFIALCRAKKIPARTVWVPDYCYAEFYLEDDEDNGHWFPCELIEKTTFGTVSNQYLILQKGDNFKVPEKKEPQRYVREYLKVRTGTGMGKPVTKFVRRPGPAN